MCSWERFGLSPLFALYEHMTFDLARLEGNLNKPMRLSLGLVVIVVGVGGGLYPGCHGEVQSPARYVHCCSLAHGRTKRMLRAV